MFDIRNALKEFLNGHIGSKIQKRELLLGWQPIKNEREETGRGEN